MQIKDSKLETGRGKVIGIGRVKIPKMSDFDYEIPLLSFIVIEKKDGSYVSSCIHLQIDGYGKTDENAQIDMVENILYFLDKNFNDEKYKPYCWENMLDLFEANENSSVLWDKYHAFQIMLAEKGHTTDHSHSQLLLLKELMSKIETLENRVKELEEETKEMKVPEGSKFVAALKDTGKLLIVEYFEFKEAA